MSTTETTETTERLKRKTRSFKVKLDQNTPAYGRYNGDSPYQAANKALSEMVRNDIKNGGDAYREHVFWIIESTKGSKRSHHQYRGHREDLEKPVEYPIGDTVIVKNHKNFLKKIKKADQDELVVKTKKATKKVAGKKVAKKATAKVAGKKATAKVAGKKATAKVAGKKATAKVATKATTKVVGKKATAKVAGKKATAKVASKK